VVTLVMVAFCGPSGRPSIREKGSYRVLTIGTGCSQLTLEIYVLGAERGQAKRGSSKDCCITESSRSAATQLQ
jgi:hypothetical protein